MMPLSARSICGLPGCRGGHWHEPAYRRAYYRRWRAAHPEYRQRDNQRRQEAKRQLQLKADRAWVDALG